MRWLRSTTSQRYTVDGHTIPSYDQEPLQVAEDWYQKILKNAVIKSLISNNKIIVMNEYSTTVYTSDEAAADLAEYKEKASTLESQLKQANAKLKKLQAKYDALEVEANAKISELTAQVAATTTETN
jgi:hypothetical protein